ncbi:putative Kinase superfamily protein [Monocercomonoides exilis]|uniref:putative Kinase superfamily protein n=1 Tax=Monocercomonoides exilis TaxID=2049356 RepID=UPI0035594834|nr:putative Kinase superfamily protein [Monocercomonoides exilis]|eukprot:MONOS_11178.1-p1 / transcript=MONOS_11178.1 / gene=MONOS_11178 / organism=Monocercomonoides_exilis_PA203 / gene_product=Kinase superfamily protein / transcript_product=Kinase superfamily protein / location=Mono_scaffold00546:35905-39810(-) / protein_length=802 / sequence_SO=supercontig / SO=protein_coding / is_pseudo=false
MLHENTQTHKAKCIQAFSHNLEEAKKPNYDERIRVRNISDGQEHCGQWENNLFDGHGTLVLEDGTCFEGDFIQGKISGKGQLKLNDDQGIFEGEFIDGKFHGMGNYRKRCLNKTVIEEYLGEFVDGKRCGEGHLVRTDGWEYSGTWYNDMFHGNGTLTHPSGLKYQGLFKNGKFEGKGKLYQPSSSLAIQSLPDNPSAAMDDTLYIECEWKKGKPSGFGTSTCDSDLVYCGFWEKGKRSGSGMWRRKQSNVILDHSPLKIDKYHNKKFTLDDEIRLIKMKVLIMTCNWENGESKGIGEIQFANGDFYKGEIWRGLPFGRGVYVASNGIRFEGVWHLLRGKGRIVLKEDLEHAIREEVSVAVWEMKKEEELEKEEEERKKHEKERGYERLMMRRMKKTPELKEMNEKGEGKGKLDNEEKEGEEEKEDKEKSTDTEELRWGTSLKWKEVMDEANEVKDRDKAARMKSMARKIGIDGREEQEQAEFAQKLRSDGVLDSKQIARSGKIYHTTDYPVRQEMKIDISALGGGVSIGRGGFGEVFMGQFMGAPAAWKKLCGFADEEAKKEFFREVALMSTFRHPNVVTLYGYTAEPDMRIVMEYCDRGSLASYIKSDQPLPLLTMVDFALQIACGMQYIHSNHVIHKDLKPANVLLSSEADGYLRCKISDMGISKLSHHPQTLVSKSGTWQYTPPEGFLKDVGDEKIDVFAFGITMWELWTRLGPFASMSHRQVRDAIVSGVRPPIPPIPACATPYLSIYSVLMQRCWDGNSENRPSFAKCFECLSALKDALIRKKERFERKKKLTKST